MGFDLQKVYRLTFSGLFDIIKKESVITGVFIFIIVFKQNMQEISIFQ